MKIKFTTMNKTPDTTVTPQTVLVKPIKHLIVTEIYNRDNIYAYGYMQEENRLFVQFMNKKNIPDIELYCYDNVDFRTFYILKNNDNKYKYIKELHKNHIVFTLPLLDVWCGYNR